MDVNCHEFTNTTTWELDMAMEEQILHDHQIPFGALWPNHYPLQLDHSLNHLPSSSNFIGERVGNNNHHTEEDQKTEEEEELGAMKETMFKIAAMQPIDIDPTTVQKPKRRNVRISKDPQSVAARHRRERISEKIRILRRLVPGGTKMDTSSMLEEAGRYIKFLKRQIQQLQTSDQQTQCVGVMGSTSSSFMKPVARSLEPYTSTT